MRCPRSGRSFWLLGRFGLQPTGKYGRLICGPFFRALLASECVPTACHHKLAGRSKAPVLRARVASESIPSDSIFLASVINTYAYVGGNPLSRVDPTGLINYEAQKFLDRLFGPTPDTSRCVTAECAAGLLPAPSDNRTQPQIDYGQCKLVCDIAAAAAVAACNTVAGGGIPGAILGTAGRLSICAMVCK